MKSHGEEMFALLLRAWKLPPCEREYRFAPHRRWRFDFAWPDYRLAVEIEGGLWVRGRHNRAQGYRADMEKYNHAVMRGWRVLRFATEDVLERPRDIRRMLEVMLDAAHAETV